MKIRNWIFVIIGLCGLVGVRMVETELFYDPFLNFFHEANKQLALPEFMWTRLIAHHVFRFALNLLFSGIILQALFRSWKWTLQGLILMALVFAITLPIYLYTLHTKLEIGYLFSFYMRRFVIQPVILLLLIPLFYYRKKKLEVKA